MSYKDIAKRITSVSQAPELIKAVFYGKPGSGKTTLFGTFPAPLHIDIRENGTGVLKRVKGLKTIKADDWDDLNDLYWYLKKEKHGYKSVGIDTAGAAQAYAIEEIMQKHKKKGRAGDWGTMNQKMWGETAAMTKELFLQFNELPMNVAFLCHDKLFKATDEEDENHDVTRIAPHIGPALSPSVASVLNAAVNVIGETFIGERMKIIEDKKTGKKEKEFIKDYYLRIGPSSSYITKVRKPKEVELPDVIRDPDFDDLIQLMR